MSVEKLCFNEETRRDQDKDNSFYTMPRRIWSSVCVKREIYYIHTVPRDSGI